MINSKQTILNSLSKTAVEEHPLPDLNILDSFCSESEILVDQFSKILKSVGGEAIVVDKEQDLERRILEQGVESNLENAVCLAPNIFSHVNKQYLDLDISHLSKIDFAIVSAEFGVSENGAVWIVESEKIHRSVFFIVQHLIVVLKKENLVHNMHQAYQRLDTLDSFSKPLFGTFISGPSKTADIEQSLVIGAHGSRSHVVFLI